MGFTMIEMTLVIIVMGILAAVIAPALTGVIGRTQADAEHSKLKTLKEALLADALEKGGFVDPLTTATGTAPGNTPATFAPVVSASQYLPASTNALALGLPLTSGFNNPVGDNLVLNTVPAYFDLRPASYLYDVHSSLTRTAAANTPLTFCTNARDALTIVTSPPTVSPRLCNRAMGREPTFIACQTTAAPPDQLVQAALVLVSRGKNRQFEFENLEGYNAAGTAVLAVTVPPEVVRTYESPSRGVNYSNDTGAYFDDAVESISLAEVVSACQKRGVLDSAVACLPGQRMFTVENGSAGDLYWQLSSPTGCTLISSSSMFTSACMAGTTTLEVRGNASCGSSSPLGATSLISLDTNGDRKARVTCPSSSNNSCVTN